MISSVAFPQVAFRSPPTAISKQISRLFHMNVPPHRIHLAMRERETQSTSWASKKRNLPVDKLDEIKEEKSKR